MISEFDKQNMADLLANKDNRYNWWSAHLLRFMARLREEQVMNFAQVFPDACIALTNFMFAKLNAIASNEYTPLPAFENEQEFMDALEHLCGKADTMNIARLKAVFPEEIASIENRTSLA